MQGGTHFIAFALSTTGVEVTATIDAVVEVPEVSPPQIDISVPAFTFTAEQGMNPPPQNFEIRNSDGGTLNYQVETNQTWLSVSPNQGSSTGEADRIEVSIHSKSLWEGTFQGTVTISDPSPSTLQAASAIIPVDRRDTPRQVRL